MEHITFYNVFLLPDITPSISGLRKVSKYNYNYSDLKLSFLIFLYFEPSSQYPPQGSRIANLFGLFDSSCWAMVFLTWLIIWYTFKLLEFIAERMGHTFEEVEIPFLPFR